MCGEGRGRGRCGGNAGHWEWEGRGHYRTRLQRLFKPCKAPDRRRARPHLQHEEPPGGEALRKGRVLRRARLRTWGGGGAVTEADMRTD